MIGVHHGVTKHLVLPATLRLGRLDKVPGELNIVGILVAEQSNLPRWSVHSASVRAGLHSNAVVGLIVDSYFATSRITGKARVPGLTLKVSMPHFDATPGGAAAYSTTRW